MFSVTAMFEMLVGPPATLIVSRVVVRSKIGAFGLDENTCPHASPAVNTSAAVAVNRPILLPMIASHT
jgi:hypothetical protein